MNELRENGDQTGASRPSLDELRSAPRFTLLIRSAKLVCDSGEYLCIIRDVSSSGVRLRLFHALPHGQRFALELSTGDRFVIERVWEAKDHAGFRFPEWIDVHAFIAETGPYPRRALRLRLNFPARIAIDGASSDARVCDLSREGARIETTLPLAIRQKVKLTAQGLPTLFGTVCWRSASAYGLALQQIFTFEELARLAAELQPFDPPSPTPDRRQAPRHYA